MMLRLANRGFTLIELLVVITIIVVLLALLTPALDRALHMTMLAMDGAQMRGVAMGTVSYASDHKRSYPDRGENSSWDAMQIKAGTAFNIPRRLEPYVSHKSFVDPFLEDARLDWDECNADDNGVYMPGYNVYLDWGSAASQVQRMRRLGQQMIFDAPEPENERRAFSILLADRDARHIDSGGNRVWATTSHQDKAGLQQFWAHHGEGNPWLFNVPVGFGNVYVAWWVATQRGVVDNHYAYDDGSVLRLTDVPLVEADGKTAPITIGGVELAPGTAYSATGHEPRITFIPDVGGLDEYKAGRRVQLPRSN
jgi:prepilin-type N-terminal cleavage/methylation domain-containing protein